MRAACRDQLPQRNVLAAIAVFNNSVIVAVGGFPFVETPHNYARHV